MSLLQRVEEMPEAKFCRVIASKQNATNIDAAAQVLFASKKPMNAKEMIEGKEPRFAITERGKFTAK